MVVTPRSGNAPITMTTMMNSIVIDTLMCCQDYDFTVAAGNSFGVFGDPAMYRASPAFRTPADLTGKTHVHEQHTFY